MVVSCSQAGPSKQTIPGVERFLCAGYVMSSLLFDSSLNPFQFIQVLLNRCPCRWASSPRKGLASATHLGAVPPPCPQHAAGSSCWPLAVIRCPSRPFLKWSPHPTWAAGASCALEAWGRARLSRPCPKASWLIFLPRVGGVAGVVACPLLCFNVFSLLYLCFSQICFKIIPNLLLCNTYSTSLL